MGTCMMPSRASASPLLGPAASRFGADYAELGRRPHGSFIRCLGPPPALAQFVEFMIAANVDGSVASQVALMRLPEPSAHVAFAIEEGSSLPGARALDGNLSASLFLAAPHARVSTIPATARHITAISLRPLGLRLIVAPGEASADEILTADTFSMETFWGRAATVLLERLVAEPSALRRLSLMEECLLGRVGRLKPSLFAVRAIAMMEQAQGQILVDALAKGCGCTGRTLQTAVGDATGLAPKTFARILRLRRAVDLIAAGATLGDAAGETGFSDQAHMSREFRSMLHESPRSLARQVGRATRLPIPFLADVPMTSTGLLIAGKPSAEAS